MTDDKWERSGQRGGFNTEARPPAKTFPSGQQLDAAGIMTESSFDYRKTQVPDPPRAEPTPDDPEGRKEAQRKAREEHEHTVEAQREAFREQFRQAREGFNDRSRER